MYYIQYSMVFFWTKGRINTNKPLGLFPNRQETQAARGHWVPPIYMSPLQFSARNIYRKYNTKKIMSWQHTEIHTNCIYDFKQIMILCRFLATTAKPFRGERCSWSLQETRTWETWFASTNIYWAPTICKALWNPKVHLSPHH